MKQPPSRPFPALTVGSSLSLSLSAFQKELKLIQTKISMQKFTAALFTAAKMWRQPRCPSSDE